MTDTSKPRPRRVRKPLSAERLREVLHYEPTTGVFTWIGPAHPRRRPGDIIGATGKGSGRGHRVVQIDYSPYYVHRLAWLYMTGEWPPDEVDHINNDPTDNRWVNLRAATHEENIFNTWRGPPSKAGVRQRRERWCVIVQAFGGAWRGSFDTKDEAIAARRKVVAKLHGAFAKLD